MDCAESPIEDYMDSACELTTKYVLRWCRVAVGLQYAVDGEEKEYKFVEKSYTYRWVLMGHHKIMYMFMDSPFGTEEEKARHMRL